MKCLRFKLETPYIVNFRKPFSTITILSYPFPPYTTVRGLLANALGLERDDYSLQDKFEISLKPLNEPERFQDMVLMKKLKPPADSKKRKDLMKKLEEHGFNLDILEKKERELYERVRRPESTSAPFVKEYVTSVECIVYVLGEENDLWTLKEAIKNPKRPLYIGGSDDFVILSEVDDRPIDIEEIERDEIDSIVRINGEVEPIDKTRIIGRVPYRFSVINKRKRDYSREDAVVAAPIPGETLKLKKRIRCFKVIDENVAF
ncbi:MAG: CRISPR-associated protein Cas5 [Spirochaetota bacterium]|nr:CRISPR-associated protein Cas5 [Spirochaetota bacterium]